MQDIPEMKTVLLFQEIGHIQQEVITLKRSSLREMPLAAKDGDLFVCSVCLSAGDAGWS
jgi:hypothetical protein